MATDKLTDNQRAVLLAAARSANLVAWPMAQTLKLGKGSATIVAKGLLKCGLIEERPALGSDAAWREREDGRRITLIISMAGMAAVGMGPTGQFEADDSAALAAPPRMPRAGSKLAILVELLSREEGATVEEMAAVTGWQAHKVRGVMSSTAKKFRFAMVSRKVDGRGRMYRAEWSL